MYKMLYGVIFISDIIGRGVCGHTDVLVSGFRVLTLWCCTPPPGSLYEITAQLSKGYLTLRLIHARPVYTFNGTGFDLNGIVAWLWMLVI